MTAPFLPDTTVQRTRAFLATVGLDTPPWLGAREVLTGEACPRTYEG